MGHKARTKLLNVRDYVVIDLETTGLNPTFDDIIEAAAIRIRNGKVVASYQSFSDPGWEREEWDEFITELTGITWDMVQGAPSNEEVIKEVADFVGKDPVLGHNVCFDLGFLKLDPELIFDTRRISQHVLNCRQTLAAVYEACKEIDQSLDDVDHHRALADCETTYHCYETLRGPLVEKYGEDPEEGYGQFARSRSKNNAIRASDIVRTVEEIDEGNPFFGLNVCFTGKLDSMTRAEAWQQCANLGAIPQDNVTKKTDYLVLGSTAYCASLNGDKSSKQKKAESMQLEGYPILIIDEETFIANASPK